MFYSIGVQAQKGKKSKNYAGKFLHDNIARKKWRLVRLKNPKASSNNGKKMNTTNN
jgi:hypothetical protein